MSQVTKNSSVIEKAFARARANTHQTIRRAMTTALRGGVIIALQIHDERHQKHIETGGSYGWGLWYDGQYLDGEVKSSGAAQRGEAEAAIKAVRPTSKGFYGIVMADMGGTYYALDYERDILNLTADEIGGGFTKYFKQL